MLPVEVVSYLLDVRLRLLPLVADQRAFLVTG